MNATSAEPIDNQTNRQGIEDLRQHGWVVSNDHDGTVLRTKVPHRFKEAMVKASKTGCVARIIRRLTR